MADSIRKQILERIKSTIDSTGAFYHTEINKFTIVDLDVIPYPSAFIYGGIEDRADEPSEKGIIGLESWEWKVEVEVWTKDKNIEELLKIINDALFIDRRLGGLADYTTRLGSTPFVVDPSKELYGILTTFQVRYSHPLGDM